MNIIFTTFKNDKVAFRFLIAVVLGLGFSIATILSTVGIMDGYDNTLKSALKKSEGDLQLIHKEGFFKKNEQIDSLFNAYGVTSSSSQLHSEVFLINEETSKGILLKGINPKELKAVNDLDIKLAENEIVIGSALSELHDIQKGDNVSLVFATGAKEINGAPLIKSFRVADIISHGIHIKDMRIGYVRLDELQDILQIDDKINILVFNMPKKYFEIKLKNSGKNYIEALDDFTSSVADQLDYQFKVKPFWYDFSTLIQAVEQQKGMIILILFLVVFISVFNVLAFIFFIHEIKSKEIFLLKALGATTRNLDRQWLLINVIIWVAGCLVSIVFTKLFNFLLQKMALFQLPAEIYNFAKVEIVLTSSDYIWIFTATLIIIMVMSRVGIEILNRKPILAGLRKEFS